MNGAQKPKSEVSPAVLSHRNEWGVHVWTAGKHRIEDLTQVEIDGKKCKVIRNTDVTSVSDMGREHAVSSEYYTVSAKVFGVTAEVDLGELLRRKKKVIATKYSTW